MLGTKGHIIELGQATSCHLSYTKEDEKKVAQEKFQMSCGGSAGCRPRGGTQHGSSRAEELEEERGRPLSGGEADQDTERGREAF